MNEFETIIEQDGEGNEISSRRIQMHLKLEEMKKYSYLTNRLTHCTGIHLSILHLMRKIISSSDLIVSPATWVE